MTHYQDLNHIKALNYLQMVWSVVLCNRMALFSEGLVYM